MSTHNRGRSTEPSQPRSQIERVLSIRRSTDESSGADVFINKESLECPPWARGAYGGQIIAQSLLAAYETVPPDFVVHSIYCHFLNAANVDLPITYHVERVRDGKSFATRVVHVRQHQRLIVSATASFTQDSKRAKVLQHAVPIPSDESPPGDNLEAITQSAAGQAGEGRPCDCVRSRVENKGLPHVRRLRQWIRARGRIGETSLDAYGSPDESSSTGRGTGPISQDGHRAHVATLAYMTDNYFIGTVFRVHNASRFSNPLSPHPMLSRSKKDGADAGTVQEYFDRLAQEESNDNRDAPQNDKHVDMMVTLDHTIFFHEPRHFRADEWLLAEMESPWAGNERGLVVERIWGHEGTLVATCIQEGVVRLSQHRSDSKL
ncbi:uncharacterized protein A1O5_06204 [Cladophialophora psammophila CBS 110553]|uniref:Palmitoyl-CoA hydrolase n=1 Tax=Cladophialophora psammophila CBS 110553 TaxID=1182543 RepID=W9X1K2_9EURO|nr:uncharacterized protein A1O5_06204 [Cladophialophora psammophila CBS 110553]EXJ71210.1 hypothetical protein A1O5_06204 [Cladophialophora psammophila CBS 110553]